VQESGEVKEPLAVTKSATERRGASRFQGARNCERDKMWTAVSCVKVRRVKAEESGEKIDGRTRESDREACT